MSALFMNIFLLSNIVDYKIQNYLFKISVFNLKLFHYNRVKMKVVPLWETIVIQTHLAVRLIKQLHLYSILHRVHPVLLLQMVNKDYVPHLFNKLILLGRRNFKVVLLYQLLILFFSLFSKIKK